MKNGRPVKNSFESVQEIFNSASPSEREFLAEWLARDSGFLPQPFPRAVALLHPGTLPAPGGPVPFLAPNPNDDDLDEAQAVALDNALAESFSPTELCHVAFYSGFLSIPERRRLVEAGLTRAEGRLPYLLGATSLQHARFAELGERIHLFLTPSFIWPNSHAWFVASEPDLAFTVVGCDSELADRLLETPVLNARAWPEVNVS